MYLLVVFPEQKSILATFPLSPVKNAPVNLILPSLFDNVNYNSEFNNFLSLYSETPVSIIKDQLALPSLKYNNIFIEPSPLDTNNILLCGGNE